MSEFQELKLLIVGITGLSKDALHIYIGLCTLIFSSLLLKRSLSSFIPWFVVFLLAIILEIPDMRDDLRTMGSWRWLASIHDILNTLFWPTAVLISARWKGETILKNELGCSMDD